jgi:acetyl/propionyl-CoA carboxylase alpha subunit
MSAVIDMIGSALTLGDQWTDIKGKRPGPNTREYRQASRIRGATISGENNHARKYGGFVRVIENRTMGDDYSGVVCFNERDCRRARRMGLHVEPFPAGVLPDGVRIYA